MRAPRSWMDFPRTNSHHALFITLNTRYPGNVAHSKHPRFYLGDSMLATRTPRQGHYGVLVIIYATDETAMVPYCKGLLSNLAHLQREPSSAIPAMAKRFISALQIKPSDYLAVMWKDGPRCPCLGVSIRNQTRVYSSQRPSLVVYITLTQTHNL